ncbi:N-acetylglucosamine-6-phosphate deacetylase [Allorhizobium sonneratiae]|uniref:N-acetylglucosamine-6-phosphate deacetylase n=1 Tax=Allorhizobium sonneratiae TaxID=2934936 RepID=UPI003B84757C
MNKMTPPARIAVTGSRIFDGMAFHDGKTLLIENGQVAALVDGDQHLDVDRSVSAEGLILAPGFIDLQVNGGGGVLFNNQPDVSGIRTICETHARFGTTGLLPTLITDRPDIRDLAIAAGRDAFEQSVPGYLGLHLEGPHLSIARKGTHDPALIRPMLDADLETLTASAGEFGLAFITIAPENTRADQVTALVAAGYKVSLGHTDASNATLMPYIEAGATLVTHLFNAMSQLGNREPGLVGTALHSPLLHCGLIADGFHVDPVTMQIALRAKQGPGRIFLVTDAMSCIGTDETGMMLNGRQIYRRDGRLTLADGTLAGADIDMLSCVRYVHNRLGLPLDEALATASRYPADAISLTRKGRLAPGADADFLLLTPTLDLHSTWIGGACVHQAMPAEEAMQ